MLYILSLRLPFRESWPCSHATWYTIILRRHTNKMSCIHYKSQCFCRTYNGAAPTSCCCCVDGISFHIGPVCRSSSERIQLYALHNYMRPYRQWEVVLSSHAQNYPILTEPLMVFGGHLILVLVFQIVVSPNNHTVTPLINIESWHAW